MKKADDLFTRLKAELQEALAALFDEADRRERLDNWISALGESPLSTLKDLAAAVIVDDDSGNGGDGGDGGDGVAAIADPLQSPHCALEMQIRRKTE